MNTKRVEVPPGFEWFNRSIYQVRHDTDYWHAMIEGRMDLQRFVTSTVALYPSYAGRANRAFRYIIEATRMTRTSGTTVELEGLMDLVRSALFTQPKNQAASLMSVSTLHQLATMVQKDLSAAELDIPELYRKNLTRKKKYATKEGDSTNPVLDRLTAALRTAINSPEPTTPTKHSAQVSKLYQHASKRLMDIKEGSEAQDLIRAGITKEMPLTDLQSVENLAAPYSSTPILINLHRSDEEIMASLRDIRRRKSIETHASIRTSKRREREIVNEIKRWILAGVLPYFDLKIFAAINAIRITNPQIIQLIWPPNDLRSDANTDWNQRVKDQTIPLTKSIFDESILLRLLGKSQV